MPVDLAFSQRLEAAEGLSGRQFVEARGGAAEWTRIGGADVLFDGPDSPVTQAFGLGMLEPATEEVLAEIERFFAERASPVNLEISPLAGVELLRMLADRGYRPVELTSVMYRPLTEPQGPVNPQIAVRIAGPSDSKVWAATFAEGWASEVPTFRDMLATIGEVMARKADSTGWLATLDGQPIASAALSLCGSVAHLAGAATIPAARGQGAQLALLGARLKHAAANGCEVALMGAAPGSASQRNAERQGFRIAYTRQKWHRA